MNKPPAPATLPRATPPQLFQTYTPRTLLPYNGTADMPVYIAVRGRVFDVSSGRNFYGPGGPYANFAGRDASRALANHSFDMSLLRRDLDMPLDDLADLTPEQCHALQEWEERFLSKYPIVGRLAPAAAVEESSISGEAVAAPPPASENDAGKVGNSDKLEVKL